MNTTKGTLLRRANFMATGICLTLQTVLKRKLIFRTSTIPVAPCYAVVNSGFSSSQSFIFHKSHERLNRH
jgi:hypothetical protein